jgi:hypothetical protein
MWISSLINQGGTGGFDLILWILLPVLCCLMSFQSRGGQSSAGARTTSDSWYTAQDINENYDGIEKEISEWRRQAEESKVTSESFVAKLRNVVGFRRKDVKRFIVEEAIRPRLYRLSDISGPVIFEFTEVEGGGTVTKATFNSMLKGRVAKFKAGLPLKIPAVPIASRCPSCSKSVHAEFKLCPYCGEKLIEE